MNYRETIAFLFQQLPMFQRIGPAAYKSSLDTTIRVCEILGNPEKQFPSVHIAGTNGKGSVAHLLASVFQEAGYKTGLFTSPHLKDFRERIRINGHMIPRTEVVSFVRKYNRTLHACKPSFFEYTFGMAMDYFARQKVEIAIVETGMGGRLDSTNLVRPVLSVITNIGFDHMQFLGDTLAKIANEKAGIMKPGCPVIIGQTQPETAPVFIKRAGECKSPIYFADQEWQATDIFCQLLPRPKLSLHLAGKRSVTSYSIESPLSGQYQAHNLKTVIAAVERLRESGFSVTEENIKSGIRHVLTNTGFKGRWQLLRKRPRCLCDTGHNPDGLREVISQLVTLNYKKLHIVFGVVGDKPVEGLLKELPSEAVYYFCKANIPRGMDAEELRRQAKLAGLKGLAYKTVKEAYQDALKNAAPEDLVFVGGSTFVVAEVV